VPGRTAVPEDLKDPETPRAGGGSSFENAGGGQRNE